MKLDELAKLAGVSRTTVSYVVNGKAKQYRVSDKTIEKVNALIQQYDFKPDILAAGLRAGKSHSIGLIIPDFENISYAKIAHQLENRCREKGYQLLISCSDDDEQNEMECAEQLLRRKIDALVVSTATKSSSLSSRHFYAKAAESTPIIGFDRKIFADNVVNLLTDDENDAFRLADKVFQQCQQSADCKKRLLFLGALPELKTSQEREKGFRKALKVRSISADFLYADHFHKDASRAVFEQWLGENALPDVIFTTSLTLLLGVFNALLQTPNGIPKNLIIATFGHHEMLELLENTIVCAVQDHSKVASRLLDVIFFKLEDGHSTPLSTPVERQILCLNKR